jgi:hypothetical protein
MNFLQFISLSILLVVQPTHADYITTNIYPDTLEQCAYYLVPILSSASFAQCVDVYGINGNTSLQVTCQSGTGTYELDTFPGNGCTGTPEAVSMPLATNCSITNNPFPNIPIPGPVNVIQSCIKGNPPQPNPALATMSIAEYATPSCISVSPTTLKSTTTSILNVCQNTGGTESFLIQCNSTTAYISNFKGYGCLSTNLNTISPLFQLGCSTNTFSATSIVVSCS